MELSTLLKYATAACFLTTVVVESANADSFVFNVMYNGTNFSIGSGPDPLATDLNVGDDIIYTLSAAGDDYWETTHGHTHWAFLSVSEPVIGSRISTGTVAYSLDGSQMEASTPQTSAPIARSIYGSIFELTHPLQFDTITITSHIDSADDTSPFQINDYQITDFGSSWVSYVPTPGDINGDGQINLTDVILTLQIVSGSDITGVQHSRDVNSDGVIGLAEAIYILKYIAEL